MKKIILFYSVLLMLIVVCGCSNDQLHPVAIDLFNGASEVEVIAESTIGPPPPDVAELLWWGNFETRLEALMQVLSRNETRLAGDKRAEYLPLIRTHIESLCLLVAREDYYTKYIDAGGIAIVGGDNVDDIFFYAAQKVVLGMTSKRPHLRERLSPEHRFRMVLFPRDLGGTVLPEINSYLGLGWCIGEEWCAVPVGYSVSKGHEDELSFAPIFIHEMGHAIHYAMQDIEPTFQVRLEAAFADANEGEGGSLFGGQTNERELWAEGTTYWFFKVSSPNGAWWGADLHQTDPLLYQLLDEVYPRLYLRSVDWEHTLPDNE